MYIASIVSETLKRVTNNGYIDRWGRRVYYLSPASYLYDPTIAHVRYQSLPENNGASFSFQIGKKRYGRVPRYRSRHEIMRHEIWICGNYNQYYFIPDSVITNVCSIPGSYYHEDYDPDHRLIHINIETHQCCYTGKCLDFSDYYRGNLIGRR